MNRLLTILLLLGATAHGQIDNPPTSVNIVDSTATGRAVLTATNAAAAATAVGLGANNGVTFASAFIGTATDQLEIISEEQDTLTVSYRTNGTVASFIYFNPSQIIFGGPINFSTTNQVATTRTNLGLGATWLTNTNVTNFRTDIGLGATNNVTFSNITASGTLDVTGNVTLSGVNNTATAQTADSGSSLMTRGLLPAATGNEPSFGPTFSFSTVTTNSATAGVRLVNGVSAQTGSATNGRSCAALGEAFWTFSAFSGGSMPANKSIDLYLHGVTFAVATNTNWVSRIIFGQGSSSSARIPPAAGSDAVTNRSWGVEFFYNGTNQVFRPFWHDGTNLATAAPQTNPLSGTGLMAAVKLSQTGTGGISVTMATSTGGRIPDSATWSTNVASFNAGNYAGQSIFIEAAGNTNQAQSGSGTGILSRAQYIQYVP